MSATGSLNHALTFTAGFLVRPCCVIPAALAVVGASGAGVAAAVAPYRPWFLLVAAAFFGASFYWNFIRNHNKAGTAVWGASVLIAAALLLGPTLRARPSPANPTDKEIIVMTDDQTTQAQIPVDGMACQACANRLQKALNQTDGVVEANVALLEKLATVRYHNDRISAEAIGEIVRKAGFTPGDPADQQLAEDG